MSSKLEQFSLSPLNPESSMFSCKLSTDYSLFSLEMASQKDIILSDEEREFIKKLRMQRASSSVQT